MATKVLRGRAEAVAGQRATINAIWRSLQYVPVVVARGRFQCDAQSLADMQLTIDTWGTKALTMQVERQLWPDTDNVSHAFTQSEFADLLQQIKAVLAARSDRLYVLANEHKAQLPLPDDHAIFSADSALWRGAI